MIAAAWGWFLTTSVGKSLRWIAGGALVVIGLGLAYLKWRSDQRSIGAAGAVEKQKKVDQEVADEADTIEDRNRVAGVGAARDGLHEYERKHAK